LEGLLLQLDLRPATAQFRRLEVQFKDPKRTTCRTGVGPPIGTIAPVLQGDCQAS
jgi:hypothetical protein